MVKTMDLLTYEYRDYSNVYNKIAFEEKRHGLIKLKRGLYETNKDANPLTIANILLSPSYISFETALSYYGLIPERVYAIKSASFKKNKKKEYKNYFGLFLYQDINPNAYPYDINEIEIDGIKILIASKEKALLDLLSVVSPRKNKKELIELLFDDLRIDEVIFDELDEKKMIELCGLYSSTTLNIFKNYLEERHDK
ncbi:MAG: hypothetical protein E7175_01155 [Erysipelotrichaceae bacterium]|nr:hypothetical protein [Erysipelotrichaceae bacterium]